MNRFREDRLRLRQIIKAQYSLVMAQRALYNGTIGQNVFDRFYRVWVWSTAIHHPLTRHANLERWLARREKIRKICKDLIDKGA